jgi:gas vesicle protein
LAPKPGEDLRQDLADTYEDISERTQDFANSMTKKGRSFAKTTSSRANKWLAVAKNLIDDLTEGSQASAGDVIDQVKGLVNNKRLNDALEWATLGYRVWQGLQSKRR